TGPQGENGRDPEQDIAGKAQAGDDAFEQDHGEGDQLQCGLPFGQPTDRQHDLGVAEKFAQAGNEEFAEQDGADRNHVPAGKAAIPGEGCDENADEQLVGNGIEHAAERGILVPGAGEIAVEPVAGGGDDVDDERNEAQYDVALHHQKNDWDDRQDAGDGDDVRDEQQRVSGHGGTEQEWG